MTYEEALQYINELKNRGVSLGLERVKELLMRLGDPQNTLRCIHVAGTNGKGSVCAFIDSALRKTGLCVGRYSSPTLFDYLERIQVNGVSIHAEIFSRLLTKVQMACAEMEQVGLEMPTVFEVETAVAFLYFAQQKCDYVVLEVGMGGRLDSTNIIDQPVLSVITPIGLDHTATLGNTLKEIALEKSGIIKNGCPVIVGFQPPEAMEVILQRCADCGIVPVIADESKLKVWEWQVQEQHFHYRNWSDVSISLTGDYQCMNAALALDVLQVLQKQEPALTDVAILSGLRDARWPGRFETICQNPLVIVDGAHNPAGAQALADTLQHHFADWRIYLLMGVFQDKDYTEIARIMSTCSDTVYCFQPLEGRGLQATLLATAVQPYYSQVTVADSAEEAVQMAWQQVQTDMNTEKNQNYGSDTWNQKSMIVSFGSLSTIRVVQNAVWHMMEG